MRRRRKLTHRGAAWYGLLATPVLVVAAVVLIGVTAGSAGPTKTPKAAAQSTAASGQLVVHDVTQTAAEVKAYWTPERMASAIPYPVPSVSTTSTAQGTVETIRQPAGPGKTAMIQPDGSVEVTTTAPASAAGALTEPFHGLVPYTQWQWFGRYTRNIPNGSPQLGIASVHKMFFTQNGTNFVCSSSTVGQDAAWTAGHCVSDGSQTFSTNVEFCPSYDNGTLHVGCWVAEQLVTTPGWHNSGDLDRDMGAADVLDTGTVNATMIGNITGWLGFTWNRPLNQNWIALGYPAAAPFTGGTIEVCASSFGYPDSGGPTTPDSIAIGCDMTGGSSGGPWILGFGRYPTQPGGNALLAVNGHNDWRHTAFPDEMASPYFDSEACLVFEVANDVDIAC